jgi:hypothetical protein
LALYWLASPLLPYYFVNENVSLVANDAKRTGMYGRGVDAKNYGNGGLRGLERPSLRS